MSFTPIIRTLGTQLPDGYGASLSALYQFDGSADWLKDRVGDHHLQVQSGTPFFTVASGLIGWKAQVNTYLRSIAPNTDLDSLTEATFEMLIQLEAGTLQDDQFCAVSPSGQMHFGMYNAANSSNIYAVQYSGSWLNAYFNYTLQPYSGEIQYAVFTRKEDGVSVDLHIDGVYCGSVTLGAAPIGTNCYMTIGGVDSSSDLYAGLFEVRYSKGYMTPAQVQAMDEYLRT